MVVSATGAWPFALHNVLVAYTIVAFNMDRDDRQEAATFTCLEDICCFMCDFCVEKKGNECAGNLTIQLINSTVDDERMQILNGLNSIDEGCNVFWSHEKCNFWLKVTRSWQVGETVSLKHIVGLSYVLCSFIYPKYSSIAGNMEKLTLQRLLPEEYLAMTDGVDSASLSHLTEFNGEMYLRRIYLVLKNEGMIGVNSDELDNHFGSRQQCLYGWVCFVLLLFGLYDSDSSNIPNVDWLKHIVTNCGCAHVVTPLNDVHKVGTQEQCLLYNVHGGAHKSISMCTFDLVNTKNPSRGMIGPGNCLWFHNLILRLVGSFSSYYKKLMKNHACIHDACGFVMTFHDIGLVMCLGYF